MAASATLVGPGGANPSTAIRATALALKTTTTGDMLFVTQGYRSRIRERTFAGVDVNGSPFAPYSTKGPFYFYPNRSATANRAARAVAAAGRHAKTGRIGVRTPTGIKYESYAAAKAAHGVGNVNLFGMEQHPHMLDAMIVKAGGAEISQAAGSFFGGGDMDAFQSNSPCTSATLGFYGDEELRARGHNEGNSKLPKREFMALNAGDLAWGEKAIAQRMMIRAQRTDAGPSGSGSAPAITGTGSSDRSDWISF